MTRRTVHWHKATSTQDLACRVSFLSAQVAYLLNLRGSDIAHCPVTMAYAIVTHEDATLFVDLDKVSPRVEEELKVR